MQHLNCVICASLCAACLDINAQTCRSWLLSGANTHRPDLRTAGGDAQSVAGSVHASHAACGSHLFWADGGWERMRAQNEMERVSLEVQAAERDYDLNRAAELKYGTLLQLQKQLREAEEMLEREMVRAGPLPVPGPAQPLCMLDHLCLCCMASARDGHMPWDTRVSDDV